MTKEKKFYDSVRETATHPKAKNWWKKNLYPKLQKFYSNVKKDPFKYVNYASLFCFLFIFLFALCGIESASAILNAIFKLAIIADLIRILRKIKDLRETLTCVLLVVSIAIGLNYLGLVSPEWLKRIWKWIYEPDVIGWYKTMVEWVFGDTPWILKKIFLPWL